MRKGRMMHSHPGVLLLKPEEGSSDILRIVANEFKSATISLAFR
jgi:hypothetical protein